MEKENITDFNLAQMEALVQNDDFLASEYHKRAEGYRDEYGNYVSPEARYGYHWNQFILVTLFNKFVLPNEVLLDKYRLMKQKAVPRKKRGKLNIDENKNNTIDMNYIEQEDIDVLNKGLEQNVNDNGFVMIPDEVIEKYTYYQKDDKIVLKTPHFMICIKGDKFKVIPCNKESIDETTTSSSSGQYSTPFAFGKGDFSHEMRKIGGKKKPIGQIYANVNESAYLDDIENFLTELKENTTYSPIHKKLGNENEANFKKDVVKSPNIKGKEVSNKEKIEDISKEAKDKTEFDKKDSNYYQNPDDIKDNVELYRGMGLEDIRFERTSPEFEEKMKNEMGEEMYDKRVRKMKHFDKFKNISYNTQPYRSSETEDKYPIQESISGEYVNYDNTITVADFNPFGAEVVDKSAINEDFSHLRYEGFQELNEDVDNYNYFINKYTKEVVKVKRNFSVNEDVINKLKHLIDYRPNDFIKPRKNV